MDPENQSPAQLPSDLVISVLREKLAAVEWQNVLLQAEVVQVRSQLTLLRQQLEESEKEVSEG